MSRNDEKGRAAMKAHKAEIRRMVEGRNLDAAERVTLSRRNDDWNNLVTGLGVSGKDKRLATRGSWTGLLMTEQRAEELVAGNNLARRIVELLPYECTREPLEFKNIDEKLQEVEDALDRLNAREAFFTAHSWAMQFGGAGVLMVTDEPEKALGEPLAIDRVSEVKSLVVFNRHELDVWAQDICTDLASPNFRKPEYYRLNVRSGGVRVQTNVRIHHSRLIRFDGQALPPLLNIRNKFWGDSVFSGLGEALRDWDSSFAGVAQVLGEFRFNVHKINGAAELIAAGNLTKLIARLQAASASRNLTGSMLIDKEEEDVTSQSETFAGVPEILDSLANRFVSHTPYPKIVLFNESPEGAMGSKGTTELEGWYNTVESKQRTYYGPKWDQLLEVLFASRKGPFAGRPPQDWSYDFRPLWQESEKEKAEREKLEAEADDLRINQGVQDEVDIQARRYPDKLKGQDPEKLRAEIEAEKLAQAELEMKRLELQTKKPPEGEEGKGAKKGEDAPAGKS